jgi:HAD superfamily hydrolase (TIGR01509 family)
MEAVIFDMDGLIIDSEPLQSQAWCMVLKNYKKEPHLDKNGLVHIVGITIEKNWNYLIKKYDLSKSFEDLEKERKPYFVKLLTQTKAMKGFYDLVKLLYSNKIPMAICSSSNMDYLKIAMKTLNIQKYFSVVISGQDFEKGKPFPDCYLATAKKLRIKPSECVVLEDSESGIISGSQAGMKVIAVPTRYTEDMDLSLADIRINSLENINLKILKELF